ncbi:helix-turn-helix domain-containing protein [Flammeovirga yaeyamensis]|uniref:Helix-turn-helix domain-containing protein n=1 Tax=Flammeovirga yaeyamensis TaxID=367791 RepID=A0AAX1N3V1_9BACT|nr:AraC family transcriptional regulator [Flammeovirga yaeyamensis]MBB3700265.1 AraC-like DNA-binding protein [Flammeovirga yaeyamensis]NMF37109.1 helix-turn-helix transcriptional regulator [Flammeovirga yaeyamensis]QWG00800.1 helix-turn-helix domain-containing protein [Flammeovirga yaeyamensis]
MREIIINKSSYINFFNELSSQFDCTNYGNELKVTINEESSLTIRGYSINDGLEISEIEGYINEPIKLVRTKNDDPAFVIAYFLTPFRFTNEYDFSDFQIQRKKYWSNIKEDEVFYFPAHQKVSILSIKHSYAMMEKYNQTGVPLINNLLNTKSPFIIYESISKTSQQIIKDVKGCNFNNDIEKLKLDYLTYQLLYNFANKVENRFGKGVLPKRYPETDVEKVFRVKNYIEENYTEVIKAENLAEVAQFSYSKLRKLFKEIVGISILQYANHYKITMAHQWLMDSTHNVSDCTYHLGFSSMTHFGKLFKDKYGCTPSEFIKKAK